VLIRSKVSSYLFLRILQRGHDSRFATTKNKPRRFFMFWMVQAVWVTLCCMPAIAVNSVHPAAYKAGLGVPEVLRTDVAGVALWVLGFAVEVIADTQKWVWLARKQKKLHDEQFITRGLWGRRWVLLLSSPFPSPTACWFYTGANTNTHSRYPNYFGDITLWTGAAIVAAGVLRRGPVQASLGWFGLSGQLKAFLLPAVAPAFVAWALLRVTGVPLSEEKYDKLYGDRKDYQEWRKNTPLLVPRIF